VVISPPPRWFDSIDFDAVFGADCMTGSDRIKIKPKGTRHARSRFQAKDAFDFRDFCCIFYTLTILMPVFRAPRGGI
jgi:hypothetical protein